MKAPEFKNKGREKALHEDIDTVHRVMDTLGIPVSVFTTRRREEVSQRTALFRALRVMGWSLPRIGNATGYDHATVHYNLKHHPIPLGKLRQPFSQMFDLAEREARHACSLFPHENLWGRNERGQMYRTPALVLAREMVFKTLYKAGYSLPQIAEATTGRTHVTVLEAVRRGA